MLKEMREIADEARLLGCTATADAMEAFAAQYIEPASSTLSVEGELKLLRIKQEDYLENERCGAAAQSCRSIVKRMRKRT